MGPGRREEDRGPITWEPLGAGFLLAGQGWRLSFQRSIPNPPPDVTLRQVHGTKIVVPAGRGVYPDADGMLLPRGLSGGLKLADCYGVALLGESWALLLHVGWRGAAGGILERGLDIFPERNPTAVLSPGICGDCYEVGPEVAGRFPGWALAPHGDKYRLDLARLITETLRRAGVRVVVPPPACTLETPFLASHRRGDKDRNWLVLHWGD